MNAPVPVVTYSRPADWDLVGLVREQLQPSQRSTTSSRLPGKAIEGTIWSKRAQVIACRDCGHPRRDLGGPHAPRFLGGVMVDCMQRPIGGAR